MVEKSHLRLSTTLVKMVIRFSLLLALGLVTLSEGSPISLLGGVSSTLSKVGSGVTGLVSGVGNGVTGLVKGVATGDIRGAVGGLTGTLSGVTNGLSDTVGGLVSGVGDVVDGVGGLVDNVGGAVSGLGSDGGRGQALDSVATSLKEIASQGPSQPKITINQIQDADLDN